MHLLFVCTGNICRSPLAERLAAFYASRLRIPDFTVSSAGTQAVIGHPIHKNAGLILSELGGDVSNFRARQLTPKIASSADLVLTMTREHRDAVLELAPRQLRATFTLSEAAQLAEHADAHEIKDLSKLRPTLRSDEVYDVPDPIGQSQEVFTSVGYYIGELLPPILEVCLRSAATAPGSSHE